MIKKLTFAAALLAATALTGVANAKTFVYCSEASPEGFDPGLYTAGTTFDASAHPVFNRLLEFKKGTTEVEPGLAESFEVSDDGLQYTFKLRPGVKFQTTEFFTPTRDLNADDVIFSFERQWKAENPWNKYVEGASWEYFAGMGMGDLIDKIEKVDDMTVKFTLKQKEAPFLANVAMPFASILSKEYADKLQADGKMNQLNQMPRRHRPVHLRRLPAGRRYPLQGQSGLLGRQAADRRSGVRDHDRRGGPLSEAEGRRMPPDALSERGRRRLDEG